MTPEQEARNILERMGIENAQSFTAGDVVEIANLIAEIENLKVTLREIVTLANDTTDPRNQSSVTNSDTHEAR